MRKSTLNVIKMHGWRIDRAFHNYVYFVFYKWYVRIFLAAGRLISRHFGKSRLTSLAYKTVYDNYHAKVLTHQDACKILNLDRDIVLSDSESKKIVPYPAANRIIFQDPGYIAVMDCPCRLSRNKPCQPVSVCMAVGRTTAEFWLDHCKQYHVRKIQQAEALDILQKSHETGKIITAWLKTETGGRTGVICSCCSCCCGGLEGMRLARQLPGGAFISNIIPSGYAVEVDMEKCTGCGACADACAFSAIEHEKGEKSVYKKELCHGCGVCIDKCRQGARKLVLDPTEGVPLDVDQILA